VPARRRTSASRSAGTWAAVTSRLSGACTTESASFDEFSSLLADGAQDWHHIVFDTAPTGHTLRLLSLPKAWTGFLDGNDRDASCLGPHSGLKMQEARFQAALDALGDPAKTTVVLVTRPDRGAIEEAARTSVELRELGPNNQRLAINGVFHAIDRSDAVACAIEEPGQQTLEALPSTLRALPQDRMPLRPFDTVGLPALRALLVPGVAPVVLRAAAQGGEGAQQERAGGWNARSLAAGPARGRTQADRTHLLRPCTAALRAALAAGATDRPR
jgi:arsenite-transporting ATPase